ncbi:hypothetical protein QUF61_11905, partial [Candidatus Venteria ishoeyi]|uniref:hypothetical protein n=1 Tax=Candidatus Venteria ishoeyi TaxID=1899563 RepID=UPI0025A615E4
MFDAEMVGTLRKNIVENTYILQNILAVAEQEDSTQPAFSEAISQAVAYVQSIAATAAQMELSGLQMICTLTSQHILQLTVQQPADKQRACLELERCPQLIIAYLKQPEAPETQQALIQYLQNSCWLNPLSQEKASYLSNLLAEDAGVTPETFMASPTTSTITAHEESGSEPVAEPVTELDDLITEDLPELETEISSDFDEIMELTDADIELEQAEMALPELAGMETEDLAFAEPVTELDDLITDDLSELETEAASDFDEIPLSELSESVAEQQPLDEIMELTDADIELEQAEMGLSGLLDEDMAPENNTLMPVSVEKTLDLPVSIDIEETEAETTEATESVLSGDIASISWDDLAREIAEDDEQIFKQEIQEDNKQVLRQEIQAENEETPVLLDDNKDEADFSALIEEADLHLDTFDEKLEDEFAFASETTQDSLLDAHAAILSGASEEEDAILLELDDKLDTTPDLDERVLTDNEADLADLDAALDVELDELDLGEADSLADLEELEEAEAMQAEPVTELDAALDVELTEETLPELDELDLGEADSLADLEELEEAEAMQAEPVTELDAALDVELAEETLPELDDLGLDEADSLADLEELEETETLQAEPVTELDAALDVELAEETLPELDDLGLGEADSLADLEELEETETLQAEPVAELDAALDVELAEETLPELDDLGLGEADSLADLEELEETETLQAEPVTELDAALDVELTEETLPELDDLGLDKADSLADLEELEETETLQAEPVAEQDAALDVELTEETLPELDDLGLDEADSLADLEELEETETLQAEPVIEQDAALDVEL